MKFLCAVAIIAAGYVYMLDHTTDLVVGQVNHLNQTYQQTEAAAEAMVQTR